MLQSVQSAIDGPGEREGQRNVTGHAKSVLLRFVDDRVESRGADEVVDLDEVGGEGQAAANGGPRIADILEELLTRRVAVDRLTAGQEMRPLQDALVEIGFQWPGVGRIHPCLLRRRHAIGEKVGERPACNLTWRLLTVPRRGKVHVHVGEARNEIAAREIDSLGISGNRSRRARTRRNDTAILNDNHRVPDRRRARSIDDRRPDKGNENRYRRANHRPSPTSTTEEAPRDTTPRTVGIDGR